MKYIFSTLCFILLAYELNAQQIIYRPLQNTQYNNYNPYNNYNSTQRYYPINPVQKTANGYLFYPLTNLPPLQTNGYTLQNTIPYVGMYYYSPSLWLK